MPLFLSVWPCALLVSGDRTEGCAGARAVGVVSDRGGEDVIVAISVHVSDGEQSLSGAIIWAVPEEDDLCVGGQVDISREGSIEDVAPARIGPVGGEGAVADGRRT